MTDTIQIRPIKSSNQNVLKFRVKQVGIWEIQNQPDEL
jgi:hypothetical protein